MVPHPALSSQLPIPYEHVISHHPRYVVLQYLWLMCICCRSMWYGGELYIYTSQSQTQTQTHTHTAQHRLHKLLRCTHVVRRAEG